MKKNQKGFAHGLILLVIVVIVIVIIGWLVYHKHGTTNGSTAKTSSGTSSQTSQSRTASNVSTAPTISSTGDLDKALQVLDQNDPSSANASDTNQLSSQSSF
jgi:hypothetical protein